MRVYIVSYPVKVTLCLHQNQKVTTLAILYVPSAILANWPCHVASYRTWGAYAVSGDVNVPT